MVWLTRRDEINRPRRAESRDADAVAGGVPAHGVGGRGRDRQHAGVPAIVGDRGRAVTVADGDAERAARHHGDVRADPAGPGRGVRVPPL